MIRLENPSIQYFVVETVLRHNIFYTHGVLPEVNKNYLGDKFITAKMILGIKNFWPSTSLDITNFFPRISSEVFLIFFHPRKFSETSCFSPRKYSTVSYLMARKYSETFSYFRVFSRIYLQHYRNTNTNTRVDDTRYAGSPVETF